MTLKALATEVKNTNGNIANLYIGHSQQSENTTHGIGENI